MGAGARVAIHVDSIQVQCRHRAGWRWLEAALYACKRCSCKRRAGGAPARAACRAACRAAPGRRSGTPAPGCRAGGSGSGALGSVAAGSNGCSRACRVLGRPAAEMVHRGGARGCARAVHRVHSPWAARGELVSAPVQAPLRPPPAALKRHNVAGGRAQQGAHLDPRSTRSPASSSTRICASAVGAAKNWRRASRCAMAGLSSQEGGGTAGLPPPPPAAPGSAPAAADSRRRGVCCHAGRC